MRSLQFNSMKIKRAIAEKGWQQKDLSASSGVSLSTISMVCNGKSCRMETALAIAKCLEVELEDLISSSDTNKET